MQRYLSNNHSPVDFLKDTQVPLAKQVKMSSNETGTTDSFALNQKNFMSMLNDSSLLKRAVISKYLEN